nr:alpha/beta hydrolase [Saccharopolyspora sp. HNM0983]
MRGRNRSARTPVLLVHGGGADNAAISWCRLITPLAGDRGVLAPDLPGFGYTEGIEPKRTSGEMADGLRALLDALGIEQVVVCGVSMGGEVALQFALRHPDRCVAVVAIAAGGLISRYGNLLLHSSVWAASRIPDGWLRPLSDAANRFSRQFLRSAVNHRRRLPPGLLDEYVREARRPGAGYAYALYAKNAIGPGSMRNNLLNRMSGLTVPALFFHGADDLLVDPEGSEQAARRAPDARYVEVPDCGHWAQLEVHDRFLAELRAFLLARVD